MIYSDYIDLQWFTMIYSDYSDLHSFTMIYNDLHWFCLIYSDLQHILQFHTFESNQERPDMSKTIDFWVPSGPDNQMQNS